MSKQLKIWTTLGLTALGSATLVQATEIDRTNAPSFLLAQADAEGEGGESGTEAPAEAGEGGESGTPSTAEGGEGGESGNTGATTYALGSTDPNAYQYDAKPQIEAYVDLVYRAYEKAHDDAKAMKSAIEAFLAVPSDETLKAARQAWVAARPAYLRTEAFRFYDGPIERVEGSINSWPVNEAYIDYVDGDPKSGLINDPAADLDTDDLEALNQKQDEADVTIGWHAIEFLLWGQDLSATGPGNRPYTDYVAGQGNNDRRRLYLQHVTDELVHELEELAESWEADEKQSYAAKFLSLPPREAIGRMVNGMAILAGYEFMSERLAVALESGDQEDEQSCFSDTTKQDFIADLEGIRQVWTGDSDGATRPGLDDLVFNIDSATADKVTALFADTEAKVKALGEPWDQVLASPKDSPGRKAAEDLVTSLQALSDGLAAAGNKLGVLVLVPKE